MFNILKIIKCICLIIIKVSATVQEPKNQLKHVINIINYLTFYLINNLF